MFYFFSYFLLKKLSKCFTFNILILNEMFAIFNLQYKGIPFIYSSFINFFHLHTFFFNLGPNSFLGILIRKYLFIKHKKILNCIYTFSLNYFKLEITVIVVQIIKLFFIIIILLLILVYYYYYCSPEKNVLLT